MTILERGKWRFAGGEGNHPEEEPKTRTWFRAFISLTCYSMMATQEVQRLQFLNIWEDVERVSRYEQLLLSPPRK